MSTTHEHVALALVHRDGRWLVARRLPNAHLGGLWEFPGGKSEANESPETTALRELMEECQVRAVAHRRLAPFIVEYAERTVELNPVICEWCSGEAISIESEECRWVTLAELRRLEMPAVNAEIVRELELHA